MKVWQLCIISGVLFGGSVISSAVSSSPNQKGDPDAKTTVAENAIGEATISMQEKNGSVAGTEDSRNTLSLQRESLGRTIATFSAQAVALGDPKTGEIFASKNGSESLPIASLTKIMAALVAIEKLPLSERVAVSPACAALPEPNQKLGLKAGQKVTVENLLYGLLVRSGADCACALAESAGGQTAFVAAMNTKAQDLNLDLTHFDNPYGNDATGNFSSANEVFRLSYEAMKNPIIRKIVGTNYFWGLPNTNQLLLNFAGITGIKTGSTEAAKQCLSASWVENGREFLGVVLGSSDRFGEVGKLIDLSSSL